MFKYFLSISIVGLILGSSAFGAIQIRTIKELHPLEAQLTQVLHRGFLWEGDAATQKVDVFDSKGSLIQSISIPHFIKYLVPSGPNHVLAVGKVYGQGWESYSTSIQVKNFKTKTTKLSEPVFAHSILSESPDRFYFGDIPEKSLASINRGILKRFGPEISVPTEIVKVGNTLFVAEAYGLGSEFTNLMVYDLLSGKTERLFEKTNVPSKFFRLLNIKNGKSELIAASQMLRNQVVLLDPQSKKIVAELPAAGSPRALSQFHHCLVVLSEESREIRFFNLKNNNALVATWNIASAGFKLSQPMAINVDESSGNVFVRSSVPCMTCANTPNSVALVQETEGNTQALCQ